MAARPAAGGGHWVEVAPERLARWIDGFRQRHGDFAAAPESFDELRLVAFDMAEAQLYPPPGARVAADVAGFLEEVSVVRRLGLLLVRRGGTGVAIAVGEELMESKVDSSYVQSRTAAGGWSQQRFARRRDNQARAAAQDAADVAARLLLPQLSSLAAVVTGGDRTMVEAVLADPRLEPVRALVAERFLDVPDPKLTVLNKAAAAARAVRIRVVDPAE